jgi:hypothetical protein
VKILLLALLVPVGVCADLNSVKSEPNLEKRSKAALEIAEEALREARRAYAAGDLQATSNSLQELEASVDLADSSLKDTHKNPSRSPKYFKHAEIATRNLLRKLETFRHEMNVGDRGMVDRVKDELQRIHETLLFAIMGKK